MIKKLIILLIIAFSITSSIFAKEKIDFSKPDIGVYVFKINTKRYGVNIQPYLAKQKIRPEELYKENLYELVVNGGFFDVISGKSVSCVTINNEIVSDITDDINLIKNLKQEDRYDKVLSRAELRILENKKHKLKFDIDYHTKPVKQKGYHIKHSLQAGPMLYPMMDLVNEGFVKYENNVLKYQSVDILKRRERTAIGLKGKYLYIVLFTKDYKVDANEMKNYMVDKLKLKKIMALDGGLSTAVNYKDISIGSLGKNQRRVKSFLVITK